MTSGSKRGSRCALKPSRLFFTVIPIVTVGSSADPGESGGNIGGGGGEGGGTDGGRKGGAGGGVLGGEGDAGGSGGGEKGVNPGQLGFVGHVVPLRMQSCCVSDVLMQRPKSMPFHKRLLLVVVITHEGACGSGQESKMSTVEQHCTSTQAAPLS